MAASFNAEPRECNNGQHIPRPNAWWPDIRWLIGYPVAKIAITRKGHYLCLGPFVGLGLVLLFCIGGRYATVVVLRGLARCTPGMAPVISRLGPTCIWRVSIAMGASMQGSFSRSDDRGASYRTNDGLVLSNFKALR